MTKDIGLKGVQARYRAITGNFCDSLRLQFDSKDNARAFYRHTHREINAILGLRIYRYKSSKGLYCVAISCDLHKLLPNFNDSIINTLLTMVCRIAKLNLEETLSNSVLSISYIDPHDKYARTRKTYTTDLTPSLFLKLCRNRYDFFIELRKLQLDEYEALTTVVSQYTENLPSQLEEHDEKRNKILGGIFCRVYEDRALDTLARHESSLRLLLKNIEVSHEEDSEARTQKVNVLTNSLIRVLRSQAYVAKRITEIQVNLVRKQEKIILTETLTEENRERLCAATESPKWPRLFSSNKPLQSVPVAALRPLENPTEEANNAAESPIAATGMLR